MKLLVTGGCGFIGSHFIRRMSVRKGVSIVNLDLLTYAGKPENLEGIERRRYRFVKGDIADRKTVETLFRKFNFDAVVNFAAESHVDRSIKEPAVFVRTNVNGALNLMECAARHWRKGRAWKAGRRFLQVSTDEVYGSLPEKPASLKFKETTPLDPSSPYSASKASADAIALSYHRTYGFPVIVTRSSNNYGPYQDAEKLIPLMIKRAMAGERLPVYGDGRNVRDWLYVEDHCAAIEMILKKGKPGEVYNVGGSNERRNIEIVRAILELTGKPQSLIQYVTDRPGHDRRYAIDSSKIRSKIGWRPAHDFTAGLKKTVRWYMDRGDARKTRAAFSRLSDWGI